MVRRSTPSFDKPGNPVPRSACRETSTPRHRHRRIAAYLRELARPLSKVNATDCIGRRQRRETRKLRRSSHGGRRCLCMPLVGNHPERNTTDTVHTSSFEYRAKLLFASSADFDLVFRPLVRSQIFAAYGTTTVRLI